MLEMPSVPLHEATFPNPSVLISEEIELIDANEHTLGSSSLLSGGVLPRHHPKFRSVFVHRPESQTYSKPLFRAIGASPAPSMNICLL